MGCRLGIITTEYGKECLEPVIARLDCGCSFQFFLTHPFLDGVISLYQNIPGDISAILTLGSRLRNTIRYHLPNDTRIVVPFGIDDAAVYRLFWRMLRANPKLDFSRVYTDFLNTKSMDIDTFLSEDTGMSLIDYNETVNGPPSEENVSKQEQQEYQKLLEVWKTGRYDIIVTYLSGAVPMLREKGVRAYCPAFSTENLRKTVMTALHEIEIRQLQDYQAAEIHINIAAVRGHGDALREQRLQLRQALEVFMGDFAIYTTVKDSPYGLYIMTDQKTVSWCTQNYTVCRLKVFLEQYLDFKVTVGYGIGRGGQQARLNALNAVRESEISGGTYLINDKEELLGPLGRDTQLTVATTPIDLPCGQNCVTLSSLTVNKVLAAIQSTPSKQITAQELALKISVTMRSANRFLSSMEHAGILQVITTRKRTTRGRPERVYAVPQAR